MSERRSYSESTVKVLFGQSGGRCAKCRKCLFAPSSSERFTITAEIAHIRAFGQAGPRADRTLTGTQINLPSNLILLCRDCHRIVDDQVDIYTIDSIQEMKRAHEAWVNDQLEAATSRVTFKELDEVCEGVAILAGSDDGDLTLINSEDKIRINGLGSGPRRLILMGSANDALVSSYLKGKLETDFMYEARLVAGLKSLYYDCIRRSLSSDQTYYELLAVTTRGSQDELLRAAGSSILSHYFIACDLFEKDAVAQ